ncbi:T9SS type A sorting domain-containing protein [Winogradskyella pacifica]|uniref:T9SS type A sorting domain-containing protein n=1 Tax=Winogradskyella pacifica TaxID=664642 RepID=UPI0015CA69FE|nr:T9SS type A sorting domain-containing protein [Winogradskyella pacifica]
MKKITLLALALAAFQFNYAQDTCATAAIVTAGTHTVAAVDGTDVPDPTCAANGIGATSGEWYSFTATTDGIATVTTDLAANFGGDTRVHVYSGACGALTCVGGNDDVATSYLSEAVWLISTGTTYYIAFDNRWSGAGFDFEISETAYSCDNSFPYSEDWTDATRYQVCYTVEDSNNDGLTWTYNSINDLDGNGTLDPIANVFPQDALTPKDDWIFTTALPGEAGTAYQITVVYNGVNVNGLANETFEIAVLDAPSSSATTQTILGSYTDITQSGTFGDTTGNDLITQAYTSTVTYTPTTSGDFHVGIHATTPVSGSDVFMLMDLSISSTLSVNDFEQNNFSHNYNKNLQTLNLESANTELTSVEIYSLVGQQVLSKSLSNASEAINVSSLTDGVYIAKVTINGNSKTIKFVKS